LLVIFRFCRPAASTGITTPAAAAVAVKADDDDDDEVDLFGSDDEEEDAEAERVKAQRVAEYNKKRSEKEAVKGKTIAKSVVTLAVKPWDDETDLDAMEKEVRALTQDGLVWGASKKVPVGYGVSMIQFTLVIEDDKVRCDSVLTLMSTLAQFLSSLHRTGFP
jgi:elongation factor 1-beta